MHRTDRSLHLILSLSVLVTLGLPSIAQSVEFDYTAGYVMWLNHMEKEAVARRAAVAIENTSPTKAVRAPSASRNGTSLVDTTSASDLIGVAMNFAGLSEGTAEGDDPTSVTATVSGYALYAAFQGVDPLEPSSYCSDAGIFWRRGSLTLGYEDEADSDQAGNGGAVRTIGLKALLWAENDACTEDASEIMDALGVATASFGSISNDVQDKMWEFARKDPLVDSAGNLAFINALTTPTVFAALMNEHGEAIEEWLNETYLVEANDAGGTRLDPFVNLSAVTKRKIAEFQGGHKVALNFLTRQRSGTGTDAYDASLLWDWGNDGRLSLTGNAKFLYEDRTGNDDSWGGSVSAAALYTPVLRSDLTGPSPLRISLSTEGKWQSEKKDTFSSTLTIRVPLPFAQLQGLELPISLSVANRTELVDETEVRGMVGFSIDTSQLFALLNPLTAGAP